PGPRPSPPRGGRAPSASTRKTASPRTPPTIATWPRSPRAGRSSPRWPPSILTRPWTQTRPQLWTTKRGTPSGDGPPARSTTSISRTPVGRRWRSSRSRRRRRPRGPGRTSSPIRTWPRASSRIRIPPTGPCLGRCSTRSSMERRTSSRCASWTATPTSRPCSTPSRCSKTPRSPRWPTTRPTTRRGGRRGGRPTTWTPWTPPAAWTGSSTA
ncbi:MAG: hypothetical protein FD126_1309, partial [Elusimicrobia bacterium]